MALFCTNCGSQIPEGARFCAACGSPAPVQQPPMQQPAQQPPVQQPTYGQAPYQQPAPYPGYDPYMPPELVPKKKSNAGIIALIAVLALAALADFAASRAVILSDFAFASFSAFSSCW